MTSFVPDIGLSVNCTLVSAHCIGVSHELYVDYNQLYIVFNHSEGDILLWDLLFLIITLREESNQTNVILQYKLLESILSAVCSVIQQ